MTLHRAGSWLLLAAALSAASGTAAAQTPAARWRTLETAHFRVLFPEELEAWATRVAERLEDARTVTAGAVGYLPPGVTDVVVADPLAAANGFAISMLGSPRLVLWASPPESGSAIPERADWTDLLLVHEEVHLAHLLRPSRSPWGRFSSRLVPIGPIALRAPRWVTEGYATLLEGRLTGGGRPYGAMRAAVLRARARAGRLPGYAALGSSRNDTWLGASMAYLGGSAFLEWLEADAGPDALGKLWRRMSARRSRTFDDAFRGVFGEDPETLYRRFAAELTWRALEVERRERGSVRDGEPWLDLRGGTGAPALSPDGGRLAAVVRSPREPPRLVVWSTEPDTEALRLRDERVARVLARDPDDVAPVESGPAPRRRIAELPTLDGAPPESPRFLGDGTILLVRRVPDLDGDLHPDLFVWEPERGRLRRLTRGADLRDPDPSPGGRFAIAVRSRDAFTQLVRVDLGTGRITPETAPDLERIVDRPRVSPDGTRVAFLRHEDGGWHLVVRDLADASERSVTLSAGAEPSWPAWMPDGGSLLATLAIDGFLDLYRVPLDGRPPERWTRTIDGAIAPQPTRDGTASYFLGIGAEGLDIRRVEAPPPTARPAAGEPDLAALVPAVPPQPRGEPRALAPSVVGPSRPYGAGRPEWRPLLGIEVAPSTRETVVGVRVGDVVGRYDALAAATLGGSPGTQGALLGGVWRGFPIALGGSAYRIGEQPSRQDDAPPGPGLDVDRRTGAVLRAAREIEGVGWSGSASVGAFAERVDPRGTDAYDRRAGFVALGARLSPSRGRARAFGAVETCADVGRSGDDGWTATRARLEAGIGRRRVALAVHWERRVADDAVRPLDRVVLGGVPSTVRPGEIDPGRVLDAALPVGVAAGGRYEGQGAELRRVGSIATTSLFWRRHRLWDSGASDRPWLGLAGAEIEFVAGPEPLFRLPRVRVALGVARILDPPLDGRTRAWLTVTYRP